MSDAGGSPGSGAGWTPERRAREGPLGVRIFRSVAGVILALFVFTALSWALSTLAGVPETPPEGAGKLGRLIVVLAAAALVSGYVAGWIAGRRPLLHGLALGVLAGWGEGGLALAWQGVPWELSSFVGLVLLTPFGAAGGALRQGVATLQERAFRRARRDVPPALPVAVRARPDLTWLGFVLALLMTAVAAWALVTQEDVALGIEGVALFGLGTLLLGYRALRPRPFLVLTEEGIDDRRLRAFIPWSEVRGAHVRKGQPLAVVELAVVEPERYFDALPWWHRTLRSIFHQGDSYELGIVLTGTEFAAPELCEIIEREVARRRPSAAPGGPGS
jgi:hypothetical protein